MTVDQKDVIWDKVEISYTEKPIHQAIVQSKKTSSMLLESLDQFKSIVDNNHEVKKQQVASQLSVLEERVNELTSKQSASESQTSKELDRLAQLVNQMEDSYRKQYPDHLKSVTLTADMTWASPTLLCLKLKEEYLRIEKEYTNLKTELKSESHSYLADNEALKDQVRSLGIQLSDLTSKYNKEKEERERIMHSLMGKDKEAFDAVRFQTVLEHNDKLKKEIEDLKFKLIQEKHLKINNLFENQEATTKLASLNTELNTLMNIKIELMNQIQTMNSAHSIHLAEKDREISHWKQENSLLGEKMVTPSL